MPVCGKTEREREGGERERDRQTDRRTVVTFRSYMLAVEDDQGESDVSIPHRSPISYQLMYLENSFSRKKFTFRARQCHCPE